jgi:DNA polymerase III alpha subunit
MAARASLKGVLRAHGVVSADEMNRITKHIPEEHKVAGELQEMKREEGASSLIKYALEHRASKFDEWCVIQDDGSLTGPLAPYFAQAIRLEGTKCAQGRHPAGVVISPDVLSTVCPMVLDPKTKKPVAGMEMGALESIGGLKLDILGLNFLDKNMGVQQILEFDDIQI